jgi:hypothetical protein
LTRKRAKEKHNHLYRLIVQVLKGSDQIVAYTLCVSVSGILRSTWLNIVLLGISALPTSAQTVLDPLTANPGRPTVSTPATITPVGYLQFETGSVAAADSAEFSSRQSVSEVMKFSVSPRFEFLVSAEPFVHYTTDTQSANGTGEVFLGVQGIVYHGEGARPTVAVSYFRRMYDGGVPEFDLGSPRNSVVLLASADMKGFHYDANTMFNEVIENTVHRAQFGQSLTISHPVGKNFAVSGEIWHFTQPFLGGNAVGNLWALSYSVRPNLVLDVGFNHGLTDTSTKWEGFVGFTYLLRYKLLGR